VKIYQIWRSDPHEGNILEWAATMSAARQRLSEISESEGSDTASRIFEFEVPLTRAGFVAFLNKHLTRDNG
jgi:hypothetical protein